MAKGAPEQQQQSGDGSLDFLWMMVLLVIAVIATWYFGKVYIAMIVFKIRFYEIHLILFFCKHWNQLASHLSLPLINIEPLKNNLLFIQKSYGSAVDFNNLAKLSTSVGNYFKYLCTAGLVSLSAILYLGGSATKFKNVFNMERLRVEEEKIWPQITPVSKLRLAEQNLYKGPWAMALDPLRFCKKNNLLEVSFKDGKYFVSLRKGAAYRVLSLQLGPRWMGTDRLPIYLQALFAVFAARIDGDKKSADFLIDRLAASAKEQNFKPQDLNFSGVIELVNKHKNAKAVQKIIKFHGYITTVFSSLLNAAREAGVLAPAEFIWLKPIDRRMWYMLNSVGRPTAVAEIAGAYAHWITERKLGLPLIAPMVDEAVKGLEIALSEIIYIPDEE